MKTPIPSSGHSSTGKEHRQDTGGYYKKTRSLRHKRKSVKRAHIAIMLAKEINTINAECLPAAVHSDELSAIRLK